MAFCEKCGSKLIEGEKFCSGCGTAVAPASPIAAAAPSESVQTSASGNPCKKCGKMLADDWLVCPYCKTDVGPKLCSNCKKELAEEWLVCPYCRAEAL